jgi:phosphoglycolate phosphatase
VQDWVVELPHAREFLQFCRQREIRSFLLSSVHRDHFAVQAARTGLGDFFDRVYVEAWDKRAKIRELLGEHRLVAKETMLVGDMEHDVETARHGGVHACAVLTGYNKLSQLRASGPDLIVENLLELQKVLEKSQLDPFGRDCRVCRT